MSNLESKKENARPASLLGKSEDIFTQFVDADFTYPVDQVLTEPADAEIWNQVRRMCLLRLRVSAAGLALATRLMDQTSQLKWAIDDGTNQLASSP